MTGDCRNERAKELMLKSCKRTFDFKSYSLGRILNSPFMSAKEYVNGTDVSVLWDVNKSKDGLYIRDWTYISALEGYIALKGAKNQSIINYLKGKTENLTL